MIYTIHSQTRLFWFSGSLFEKTIHEGYFSRYSFSELNFLSAIIADFFESLFVNKQDISNASRAFSKDLTHSFGDRVSLNPPLQPFRVGLNRECIF